MRFKNDEQKKKFTIESIQAIFHPQCECYPEVIEGWKEIFPVLCETIEVLSLFEKKIFLGLHLKGHSRLFLSIRYFRTPKSIRYMEAKSLRKLRYPGNSKKLRMLLGSLHNQNVKS